MEFPNEEDSWFVGSRVQSRNPKGEKQETIKIASKRILSYDWLMTSDAQQPVIILGAGLSGLAAARTLHSRKKSFVILDAKSEVGGRVATESFEGFLLDQGFQVLLSSYSELSKFVSLPDLKLRSFNSGALIVQNSKADTNGSQLKLLANPLEHPGSVPRTLISKIGTWKDKYLVLKLLNRAQSYLQDSPMGSLRTMEFLKQFGFSRSMIENFWQPFLNGVFLDPELTLGSDFFLFLIRAFAGGKVCLPADGMVALPKAMARGLPPQNIRLQCEVQSFNRSEVFLRSGERLSASQVICAFDEGPEKTKYRSVSTFYFKVRKSTSMPFDKWLVLVPRSQNLSVNHLAVLSEVSPSYSPKDWALLSASVVGGNDVSYVQVQEEIEKIGGRQLRAQFLKKVEVPRALPQEFPTNTQGFQMKEGVIYCGDRFTSPSIQGALRSGRLAAEHLLK